LLIKVLKNRRLEAQETGKHMEILTLSILEQVVATGQNEDKASLECELTLTAILLGDSKRHL
jgi:hypothetical protein